MSNIFYSAHNVALIFKTAPDNDEDLRRLHGVEDALKFSDFKIDGSYRAERVLIRAALWMTRPEGLDAIDNMPHSREEIEAEGDFGKRTRMSRENHRWVVQYVQDETNADRQCWETIEGRGLDGSGIYHDGLGKVIGRYVARIDIDGAESVAWVERARTALFDLSEADRRGLTLPEYLNSRGIGLGGGE